MTGATEAKLTETCPACGNDLAGGVLDGGLDLTKSSCGMCGFNIVIQPEPAAVVVPDEQPVDEPAKASVAKKAAAPKKVAAKVVAKKSAPAPASAVKITVTEGASTSEKVPMSEMKAAEKAKKES